MATTTRSFPRRYPTIELTEFQKGWLCGLIEGEGTVTIKNQGSKNKANYQYPQAAIVIVNTVPDLLYAIKGILGVGTIKKPHGGGFAFSAKTTKIYRRSTAWEYLLTGNRAVGQVLALLSDDFIVKKAVADLVLEYCRARALNHHNPLSSREAEIIMKVHEINTARYHKGGGETRQK